MLHRAPARARLPEPLRRGARPSGAARSRPGRGRSTVRARPPSWSASSAGSCSSRPATAWSSTGSTRSSPRRNDETADGPRPARLRRSAPTPTSRPSASSWSTPIIQRGDSRGASRSCSPARPDAGQPDRRRRRAASRPGSTLSSVPELAARSTSTTSPSTGLDLHDDPRRTDADGVDDRRAGHRRSARRSSCPSDARAPTRSTTSSRSTSRSETLALVTPGAADRRRSCCCVLVAGVTWLVTRQVVTPVRLARRVAERLAAGQLAGADAGVRRGRPRPAGDVVQPDGHATCSARSASSRSSAGSSAASSPTSPTSCAPR